MKRLSALMRTASKRLVVRSMPGQYPREFFSLPMATGQKNQALRTSFSERLSEQHRGRSVCNRGTTPQLAEGRSDDSRRGQFRYSAGENRGASGAERRRQDNNP